MLNVSKASSHVTKCKNCGYTLFKRLNKISFQCLNCGRKNILIVKN